jgi:hypothetical protein
MVEGLVGMRVLMMVALLAEIGAVERVAQLVELRVWHLAALLVDSMAVVMGGMLVGKLDSQLADLMEL